MQGLDAHGVLRDALLKRKGTRKSGAKLAFRCPRHADATASAWMGDHAWGCSACGFSEPLRTLGDELGITLPESNSNGLTLFEYAERKGLSLERLRAAGVEERTGKYGETLVAIPYRDAEGQTIRTKCRTRKGTFWLPDGTGTPLYGQDVLAQHPDAPVLIVEGESDCHAGWQRGLVVVGVPGASLWRPEYGVLLAHRDVCIWQEPDEGGATLVANIARSLPNATVLKEVTYRETRMKDLCDLHQAVSAHGDTWDTVWATVIAQAVPIGTEPPAVAFDRLIGDTLDQMLEEKLAPVDAVPTMLPQWNTLCHGGGGGQGLARGWFVTIGAIPGTGKSLIALNLAAEAIKHGEVVTFLSLEMGRNELATRLLSVVSGESVISLEQGESFSPDAYRRAARSLNEIRAETGGYVMVNRQPISRLADIEAAIKYHAEVHGSRYFLVDYMQLAMTGNQQSTNERIEQVAHRLRELTQTYRVVTVALSQFNRQTSANRAERPVAQGLHGGSAIENDSHQVLLFDHSRFERTGNIANTWLIMDKNRHGPCVDLPVRWDFRTLRLETRVPPPEKDGWSARLGTKQPPVPF